MRFAVTLFAALTLPVACLAAPFTPPSAPATDFRVEAKTTIPGAVLAPGQYTINVIEHLNNRVILQVSDKKGKVRSTFLGLENESLPEPAEGPVFWGGKLLALRGFAFPGALPVEFVYPKAEAVAIAQGNTDKVLAIDPASDNLSFIHDRLSTQDMQIVTLWTLKSTRVGPGSQPAIEASRYQAPVAPAASAASPAQVASASPTLGRPSSPRHDALSEPVDSASAQEQAVLRKPRIAALPHTASYFPLLLLCSILCLLGAAILGTLRRYADAG